MRSIRITTRILLVLFALVMNCIYSLLALYRYNYGDHTVLPRKLAFSKPVILKMNVIYYLMHVLVYIGPFLFLVFCNRFVRKNHVGSGYPFFIILLGFFPIANWFLRYIIWLKLNKTIHTWFQTSSKVSGIKIILAWILSVGSMLFFLIGSFLVATYSSSPEMVTSFETNRNLVFLIVFIALVLYSITACSYYWNFLKLMKGLPSQMEGMGESQLLDNPD